MPAAPLVQWRLPARARGFLIAASGRAAALPCSDGALRICSFPEGKVLQSIATGKRQFDSVTISDDGGWIAAGDHDGRYTVWNAGSGAMQHEFQLPWYASALAFSPDATRLAVAPAGEPVRIHDTISGRRLFDLQTVVGGTQGIAFSRDGRRIATADSDTVVRIYDARNGELLARNNDFLLEPLSVSFSKDGRQVVAAGADKVVAVLDTTSGKAVAKSAKLADPVAFLAVSPDGVMTASALMHADNLLQPAPIVLTETRTGSKVEEWLPPQRLLGGGWIADGRLIAATAVEAGVQVWRVR